MRQTCWSNENGFKAPGNKKRSSVSLLPRHYFPRPFPLLSLSWGILLLCPQLCTPNQQFLTEKGLLIRLYLKLNSIIWNLVLLKLKTVLNWILLFVCLFVTGDTYYSITVDSRQGSLAKPLSLLFLTPRTALSSHQLKILVFLFKLAVSLPDERSF